jgi:putative membrane protein
MSSQVKRTLIGATAGLVATIPMSAWMIIGKRLLSWRSQEPLPPVQITRNALRAVNLDRKLSGEQETALSVVNHFAYGAGVGGVYSQIFSPQSADSAVASGITFGLGVWTASYMGWLPGVGLYRSPGNDTIGRTNLMIAAHMVWGGTLGLMSHFLSRQCCAAKNV